MSQDTGDQAGELIEREIGRFAGRVAFSALENLWNKLKDLKGESLGKFNETSAQGILEDMAKAVPKATFFEGNSTNVHFDVACVDWDAECNIVSDNLEKLNIPYKKTIESERAYFEIAKEHAPYVQNLFETFLFKVENFNPSRVNFNTQALRNTQEVVANKQKSNVQEQPLTQGKQFILKQMVDNKLDAEAFAATLDDMGIDYEAYTDEQTEHTEFMITADADANITDEFSFDDVNQALESNVAAVNKNAKRSAVRNPRRQMPMKASSRVFNERAAKHDNNRKANAAQEMKAAQERTRKANEHTQVFQKSKKRGRSL